MRAMSKVLLAAIAATVCCTGAMASVSLEPASGYVHLPDAQVAKQGTVEAFAAYVTTSGTNELARLLSVPVACKGDGYTVGALGGPAKNVELGASFISIDKKVGNANAFAVAAKWQFLDPAKYGVAAALGAQYRNWHSDMSITLGAPGPVLTIDLGLPAVTSVYLALDKSWKPRSSLCGVTGTVGAIYNHYGSIDLPVFPTVDSKSFVSPFVGLRLDAARWSVLGEFRPALETGGFSYQSELWSVAVRSRIAEGTWAMAGVSTFNLPYTSADPAFFFEVSHCFGK